ncbi:MAG TPA: ferritin-like domain-containing protein [Acidimicrobiales bacterium]|nr:ferritin-like domain-containing protein [Acidimicrobiales bacterium]
MASEGLHEPESSLDPGTIERHRANVSLKEELEAIDWYDQRADATADDDLRDVLRHNRDDEKEHAAMNLEWLRRHDPELDQQLRLYLFTEGPISEPPASGGPEIQPGDAGAASSLGLGGLRSKEGL